jgi:ATP/maltotriose-dependent transcriptional regulator MalT
MGLQFDSIAFGATLRRLRSGGDASAVELFLKKEKDRLLDAGIVQGGGSCCCGKSMSAMECEDAENQRNRYEGLIVVCNELASLRQSRGQIEACLSEYDESLGYVSAGGLEDTPIHLRILVSKAYAALESGEVALADTTLLEAEDAVARCPQESVDAETLARLYDAKAVVLAIRNDNEGSQAACDQSEHVIDGSHEGGEELASMMLNHAATLAQVGRVDDVSRVIDTMLQGVEEGKFSSNVRYQALNLKARVALRQGNSNDAASALSELIETALAAGDLAAELPAICRNCAEVYRSAGDGVGARHYDELAEKL